MTSHEQSMREATSARAASARLLGPSAAAAPVQPRHRLCVMLVDDDAAVAKLFLVAMEPIGAEVIVCPSIEDAFAAMWARPIGTAVVDWALPERKGEPPAGKPEHLLRTMRRLGIDAVVWSGHAISIQQAQGYRVIPKGSRLGDIVSWVAAADAASEFRLPEQEMAAFEAAETYYHSLLSTRADLFQAHGSACWDGSLLLRRLIDRVAPIREQEPLFTVLLRERVGQYKRQESQAMATKCVLTECPLGLQAHVEERTIGDWRELSIMFPFGWEIRKTPGRLSVALESIVPDVFRFTDPDPSDPLPDGLFCQKVERAIGRLELFFEFPDGFEPLLWLPPMAWWGQAPDAEARNVIRSGVCTAFDWRPCGSSARLIVERPLPGFTFALAWTIGPVERVQAARKAAMED